MKKNLTKLDAQETPQVETDVTEKYRGKIIYTTPTAESVNLLEGFKGVVYGPSLYIKAVIGDFDNDIVERLRAIQNGDVVADQWIKENAEKVVVLLDGKISGKTDLNTFQGALMAIVKSTNEQLDDPVLKAALKSTLSNTWKKTMEAARAAADKGYTVVFDQNAAAKMPEIDIAFIDNTSLMVIKGNKLVKSYADAVEGIPAAKKANITGKGLLNILSGRLDEGYVIPNSVSNFNEAIVNSTPRSLKELILDMSTMSKLGMLESLLASQNVTVEGARTLVAQRQKELKNRLDITDAVLQVSGTDPVVVEYEQDGKRKEGIVKSNNGIELEIVPFQPNMTMEDLYKQSEIVKFSSKEVPFNVFPISTQKPVTVDPEVKNQSDNANTQNGQDFANNAEILKQAMANNTASASEVGNTFLDSIKCN